MDLFQSDLFFQRIIFSMTTTNNVIRFLSSKKIDFQVFESEPVRRSAMETATLYHLDPMIVYKTIVAFNPIRKKYLLCVIPAPYEVNLKKLASAIGEKKAVIVTQHEAEVLTGLEAGGISPFALYHKGFQIWVHDTIRDQEKISVSGGQRGLSILLSTSDFIQILQPKIADIADIQQDIQSSE